MAASDELVPYPGTQTQRARIDSLGLRYEFDTFAPAEHLTLAYNDQYAPAASFLGTARVNRNPAHVTYVYNPRMEHATTDAPANHAYWVSGLALRSPGGDHPLGTIDVRSEGFGEGDPTPSGTQAGAGSLTGGNLPAIGYQSLFRTWGATPKTPKRNRLDITAKNVRTLSVNAQRARVNCDAALHVTTDGPVTVVLPGCGETVRFTASGTSPGACRDRDPPDATLRAAGIQYSRGRLTLKGSASDRGCKGTGQLRSKAGHVSRVIVAVAKVNGSSCRFLQPNGKLTSARRCRKAVWLPASGTGHWRFSKSLKLPHGGYRASARAYDASGNRSTRRGGVPFTL